MANRNWASGGKMYSMHVKPVIINATIQIGASGAVSSFVGSAVASVTQVSTGVYKLTLQRDTNFSRLYFAAGAMQSASAAISGISVVEVQHAPNAAVSASPATLTVTCLAPTSSSNTTLVATNPASGSALNVILMASDSSVLINGE